MEGQKHIGIPKPVIVCLAVAAAILAAVFWWRHQAAPANAQPSADETKAPPAAAVLPVQPAQPHITQGLDGAGHWHEHDDEIDEQAQQEIDQQIKEIDTQYAQGNNYGIVYAPGELEAAMAVNRQLRQTRGEDVAPEGQQQWFSQASGLPVERNVEMGRLFESYTSNAADPAHGIAALRPPAYDPLINGVGAGSGAEIKTAGEMPFAQALQDARDLFKRQGYVITALDRDMLRWWLGRNSLKARGTQYITDSPDDDWKVYAGVLMLKGYPFAARYLAVSRLDTGKQTAEPGSLDRELISLYSQMARNTTSAPNEEIATPDEISEWYRVNRIAQGALQRLQQAWLRAQKSPGTKTPTLESLQENPALQEYLYSAIYDDAAGMSLTRPRVLRTVTPQQAGVIAASVGSLRRAIGHDGSRRPEAHDIPDSPQKQPDEQALEPGAQKGNHEHAHP